MVKSKGIEVRFHGRGKNEASHYCGQCEVSSVRPVGFENVSVLIICLYSTFRLRYLIYYLYVSKRKGTLCIAWIAPESKRLDWKDLLL